jgi:glucose-1-phosphate adenylyltransferase
VPQRRHPPHLRADAVQLGVAQPPHLEHLPARSVLGRLREIFAAEQTPDNQHWFQGTADAVRKAARHFSQFQADYFLVLAGDHICRVNYRAFIEHHKQHGADITIAAQPIDPVAASSMGIFVFDRDGHIVAFEEKPKADRLAASAAARPRVRRSPRTPTSVRSWRRWASL